MRGASLLRYTYAACLISVNITSAFQIMLRKKKNESWIKNGKKKWEESFDSYYEALWRYVPENSENHKNTQIKLAAPETGAWNPEEHIV